MRTFAALCFVLTACGSSPKQAPINENTDNAAETCCCKSNPLTSEDGMPLYEIGNRMECSTKQGTCVDEVQCAEQPAAPESE